MRIRQVVNQYDQYQENIGRLEGKLLVKLKNRQVPFKQEWELISWNAN